MTPASGQPERFARSPTRRGSVYVFALMISLLVTAMGVGAALSAQTELAAAELRFRGIQTRLAAQSALELGVANAQTSVSWRSSAFASAPGFLSTTLGGATIIVQVDNGSGGAPTADAAAPIRLRATATSGAARHGVGAIFTPVLAPAKALSAVAYAGRNLSFLLGSSLKSADTVGANSAVTAFGASVGANVYSGGTIGGLTYNGTTSINRVALTMPDPALVDEYVALGTPVPHASFVAGVMNQELYSPVTNAHGAANAAGIYVINCGGTDITIRNSRVYGTLVLLDPGAGSKIDKLVCFEPLDEAKPSLIVRGNILINTDAADLAEGGTNLNPPGAPYLGATNTTTSDTYASAFHGIVYATGNITLTGNVLFEGSLVAGNDLYFGLGAKTTMQRVIKGTIPTAFATLERFTMSASTYERLTY